MSSRLLSLYGLKYSPFSTDVPTEALYVTAHVDAFLRRVELGIADGGFAMVTGDPGTSKSVVLRLLEARLRALPNVVVGTIEHPQSRTSDFYRELGDLFGVPLAIHNRWGGFKALRARWSDHIASTLTRPVLIMDEGPGGAHPRPLGAAHPRQQGPRRSTTALRRPRRRCTPPRAPAHRRALATRLAHPTPPRPRVRLPRRAARLPRAPPRRRRQCLAHDR